METRTVLMLVIAAGASGFSLGALIAWGLQEMRRDDAFHNGYECGRRARRIEREAAR